MKFESGQSLLAVFEDIFADEAMLRERSMMNDSVMIIGMIPSMKLCSPYGNSVSSFCHSGNCTFSIVRRLLLALLRTIQLVATSPK